MMDSSPNNTPDKKKPTLSSRMFLIGSLTFLAAVVGCYFVFPGFHAAVNEAFDVITSGDEHRIKVWVKQFGMLGPLALIVAMGVQMFLLVVPNILLFAIATICYGVVWGTLISLAGVFLSSTLGYFIGKKLGPRAIDRFVSQKTQDKIKVFVDRYGIKAIVAFRLSSLSTDSLGFVAGILEMTYKKYILSTLVGVTPVIVLIGIYGRRGKIETALIWVGAISLVSLLVYIFLDRKKRREAYSKIAE